MPDMAWLQQELIHLWGTRLAAESLTIWDRNVPVGRFGPGDTGGRLARGPGARLTSW